MTALQHRCAMPLGQVLARFELHWDDPNDEHWSKAFTQRIHAELEPRIDPAPERPYRGDIWLEEQGWDEGLRLINKAYNRRGIVPNTLGSDNQKGSNKMRRLRRRLLAMIHKITGSLM